MRGFHLHSGDHRAHFTRSGKQRQIVRYYHILFRLLPTGGRVTFSNFLGHSTAPYQFEVEGAFALYFWPTYFFLGCFFSSEVVVSPEFSMFYGIVYRNQVISTL